MSRHPAIRVHFRVFNDDSGSDVIALWRSPDDRDGMVSSYQHVGQHSLAMGELIDELRQATEAEKGPLRLELRKIGYVVEDADKVRKPTHVLVHWSESRLFPHEEETYTFTEFELIASQAAWRNPPEGCYDKTKITVTFDDGETYQCRLDLKQGDTKGFRDHAEQVIYWHEKREGGPGGEHYAFLKAIDFDSPVKEMPSE